MGIENTGRGPAKSPFMQVSIKPPYKIIDKNVGIDGNGSFGLRRLVNTRDCNTEKYGAAADTVIHPNTIHDVTAVVVTVKEYTITVEDAELDYIITAEDVRLIKGHAVINGAELRNEAKNYASKENRIAW